MKTRSWLTSFALAFCFAVHSPVYAAAEFKGLVVGVADGDTISVMHRGRAEKVRLCEIDCPEKKQAFGERAKQFTASAAFKKVVLVKVTGCDRYGRSLGEVVLPDRSNLNTALLRAGLAWVYMDKQKNIQRRLEQQKAQIARRGLWQDKQPTPPWQWRKQARARQATRVAYVPPKAIP